jgi:lipid II:glycine glycyltransferase (peptidoglycan interpeptide bridge formation enzyme)
VGRLFEVGLDDEVFSSVLILLSDEVGYYHSAGSSDRGRRLAASHYLVDQVADRLRSDGRRCFNLGGASSTESGLARFKLGFGASIRTLEAAAFYLGSPAKRFLSEAWLRWRR